MERKQRFCWEAAYYILILYDTFKYYLSSNITTYLHATFPLLCASLSTPSLVLGPLGCGLNLSRLDASIFKKELATWSPGVNLDWDPDLHTALDKEFQ
jgi:hypothetical protein